MAFYIVNTRSKRSSQYIISKIKNCLNNASSCKKNKKKIGKLYQEKIGYLLQSLYPVNKRNVI